MDTDGFPKSHLVLKITPLFTSRSFFPRQTEEFDIIHTVVLIRYIYLLEISVKHNDYCISYSLKPRTTCFGLNRPSSGPQELNYV